MATKLNITDVKNRIDISARDLDALTLLFLTMNVGDSIDRGFTKIVKTGDNKFEVRISQDAANKLVDEWDSHNVNIIETMFNNEDQY
jgi:hypothetical protein